MRCGSAYIAKRRAGKAWCWEQGHLDRFWLGSVSILGISSPPAPHTYKCCGVASRHHGDDKHGRLSSRPSLRGHCACAAHKVRSHSKESFLPPPASSTPSNVFLSLSLFRNKKYCSRFLCNLHLRWGNGLYQKEARGVQQDVNN